MREIKFRAWDKKTKKIRNVEEMGFGENDWILLSGVVNRKTKDVELMQGTGLKDKNDKEIYDGDLVEFYPNANEKEEKNIGIVKYSERRAAFMFSLKEFNVLISLNIPSSKCLVDPDSNIEIIGNIYENPELLTK